MVVNVKKIHMKIVQRHDSMECVKFMKIVSPIPLRMDCREMGHDRAVLMALHPGSARGPRHLRTAVIPVYQTTCA
jgi:hypothetical protein